MATLPELRRMRRDPFGLFGLFRTDASDCDVVFCLEREPRPTGCTLEAAQPKRRRRTEAAPTAVVGAPLPADSQILGFASERFRVQLARWAGGAATGAEEAASSSAARRPQLRVPLGSEAEAPFARAAINFAHTGWVAADGMSEVLEVRRQAGYLGISSCVAACDELLVGMLAGVEGGGGGSGQAAAATAAAPVAGAGSSPAAAELIACWDLLPDPVGDPSFAPVMAAAKKALVRHFGDALAALNTPSLRQQLLQLPAAAVEVLLSSEAFGTDTEDSVLLLLATWTKVNFGQSDAATRERLCRLVRLVQLGRPYLTAVLPALAADYETGAAVGSPCAWFPIRFMEASFISALATAPAGPERRGLLTLADELYDAQSPWYNARPRPQCLSEAGRAFEWTVIQQELLAGLCRLQNGELEHVYGSFPAGRSICARGFEWQPYLQVKDGAASVSLFLACKVPDAYDLPGSRLGSGSKLATVVGLDARLTVHSWRGGARQDAYIGTCAAKDINFSTGQRRKLCWPSALPLSQPQPAGGSGSSGDSMLAGWGAYLHNGRLTGSLTLLPRRQRWLLFDLG